MKTASLPNCGSARRSAEGRRTRTSTCRGREAEGAGGLELALGRRLDRAADDLGHVGAGVEREGDDRAPPGLAQEGPGPALADPLELGEAVVDEEGLHQERRAAEEVDVGVDQPARPSGTRRARARPAGSAMQKPTASAMAVSCSVIQTPCGEERPVGEDELNAHGRAPRAPRRSSALEERGRGPGDDEIDARGRRRRRRRAGARVLPASLARPTRSCRPMTETTRGRLHQHLPDVGVAGQREAHELRDGDGPEHGEAVQPERAAGVDLAARGW